MDEPTASLDARETGHLHDIVRALVASGTTIILISHFLKEVLQLADTVTVLRDGRLVKTAEAASETEASLIEAMLGRPLTATFPPKVAPPADAPVALSVRDLYGPGVEGVSLELRAGEILGLAGLVGAGRTELARTHLRRGAVGKGGGRPGDRRAARPKSEPEPRRGRGDDPRVAEGRGPHLRPLVDREHDAPATRLAQLPRRRPPKGGAEGGAHRARAVRRARRELRSSGRDAVRREPAEGASRADAPLRTARRHRRRAHARRRHRREARDLRLSRRARRGRHGDPPHLLRARGDHRPRPPRARHAPGPHGGGARRRRGSPRTASSPRRSPTSLRKPLHDVRRLADAALDDARADALDGRALPPPRRHHHSVPRALPHALAGQRAVRDERQPPPDPRPAVGDPDHRRGRNARARRRRDRPLGRRGLRVRRGHRRELRTPPQRRLRDRGWGSAPACSLGCSTESSSPSSGSTR